MRLRDRLRLSIGAFRISGANRRLRLVQLARLASVTGRWAYTVTLAVYAYRLSGASGVALAGIVRLAPAALVAPFAGILFRRTRLEALLAGGGVLRVVVLAAAGAATLLDLPSTLVYGLVAVESATSTLMRPIQNSILPDLARTPEELTSTNLALSVIESAGVFLGPLVGAALLHGTSIGAVFAVAAGFYLVSTILLAPIRVELAPAVARAPESSFFREAVEGARVVAADRSIRVVVLLYGAQNLVAGALNVLIVVTALRLLHLGQSGVGTLTAAVGVGGVIGGALALTRLRRRHHGADLGLGLLLWGTPLLVMSLLSSRTAALVLLGVVGIGVTLVDVAAVTLLQRTAPGELLAHALALLQTVFVTTVALGTICAPALVSIVGVRGALGVTGAVLPVLAVVLWHRLRTLDDMSRASPALVSLLAGIPIFAPLSDAALDRLATSLRMVSVPAGTTVFEQGDDGDAFYAIEEGTADVLIDGSVVRTLSAGGYFGEIALLRNVPRTATILALTDLRLQRLERNRFLETVMGSSASTHAANAVVGARLGLRAELTTV